MSRTKELLSHTNRSANILRWYVVSFVFPSVVCVWNVHSTAASQRDQNACDVVMENHKYISTHISVDKSQHNRKRNRDYYIPIGRHWFGTHNENDDTNNLLCSKIASVILGDKRTVSPSQDNNSIFDNPSYALQQENIRHHDVSASTIDRTVDDDANEIELGSTYANVNFNRECRPNYGRMEWRSYDNKIQSSLLSSVESVRRLLPKGKLSLGSVMQSIQNKKSTTSLPAASTAVPERTVDSTLLHSQQDANDDAYRSRILDALAQPLIEETIWDEVIGNEFQLYPELWDKLASMGEDLARNDNSNEWIEWNTIMKGNENDISSIHVWTGRTKKPNVRGSSIPFIKTRSVIPYRPRELATLLLDSTRVKSYSKFSVGRIDCWLGSTTSNLMTSTENDSSTITEPFSFTKIVQNRIQPPLGGKQMISTTFMHAQPSKNEMSYPTKANEGNDNRPWITVSRAVGGKLFSSNNSGEDDKTLRTSEILLGVNFIQPYDDSHSVLTSINHVYSAAVPTMLAERIGVKSAIQFINDLCALKGQQKL
jgi:hypothetical protein